jgi:hypothetical protein
MAIPVGMTTDSPAKIKTGSSIHAKISSPALPSVARAGSLAPSLTFFINSDIRYVKLRSYRLFASGLNVFLHFFVKLHLPPQLVQLPVNVVQFYSALAASS